MLNRDDVIEYLLSLPQPALSELYRDLAAKRLKTQPITMNQSVRLDGREYERYLLLTGRKRVPLNSFREYGYFDTWLFRVSNIHSNEEFDIQGLSGRIIEGVDITSGFGFNRVPRNCLTPA